MTQVQGFLILEKPSQDLNHKLLESVSGISVFILIQIFLEGPTAGCYAEKADLASAVKNYTCTSRKWPWFSACTKGGREQLTLDLVGETHTLDTPYSL